MKKMMLTLALAVAAVTGAFAGTVTVTDAYFGGTNIMVLPPAIPYDNWAAFPERTATNVVAAGAIRRQGTVLIAAANAGTTSNALTTTTSYYTNANLTVTTNTYIRATPITIPESGLSAVDGSVYWMKVPPKRSGVILTVTLSAGIVTLSDIYGGTIPVAATTVYSGETFEGYEGALFATKSVATNVTVSTLELRPAK